MANIETIRENEDGSFSVVETTGAIRGGEVVTFTSWDRRDCVDFINAQNGQLVKHYGDDLELDEGAGIYSKTSYEFDERR